MINKVYSMLGLAEKAGCMVSGEFSTEKAVKGGKAHLVILASDASGNTRKHFSDMCAYRNIRLCIYGDKEKLGHAVGKGMRSSLAVTDRGLADSIRKRIEELEVGREDAELSTSERRVLREFTVAKAAGNCSQGIDTGREDAELE